MEANWLSNKSLYLETEPDVPVVFSVADLSESEEITITCQILFLCRTYSL